MAGLVAPFVTNWVKKWVGVAKVWAIFLAVAVSMILSLVAVLVTNGSLKAEDMTVVFSISTVIYKLFLSESSK